MRAFCGGLLEKSTEWRAVMPQAAAIGNRATIPLGVAKADLNITSTIFCGQQGSVLLGTLGKQPVAVKKARISTGQARKMTFYRMPAQ
jgi:hypothetical protein